ncbi:MAG: hypothetical protein C0592_06280 [Marinilabiliales bacterium]|nr:MAG: hypothetical protein C0592_06280 [Marinilabiliales bacterium]
MKKTFLNFLFISIIAAAVLSTSCKKDDDDNNSSPTPNTNSYAIETDSFGLCTLRVEETGGPTNEWYFATQGDTGNATLIGVGDFPYSYAKTGNNTSTLIFNVGGSDQYLMTWTSDTSGSFQESFDGVQGNPGVFTIRD